MSEPSERHAGRCACPGCDRDAVGNGIIYCPACDDGFHLAHCPQCRQLLFQFTPACPKCGANLSALYAPGAPSDGDLGAT